VIDLISSATIFVMSCLRNRGLHSHHLHHVADDLDLPRHEGLHARRLVLIHEDRLRGRVVGGHGCIGIGKLAEVHHHLTRAGVHETLHRSFAEGHVGDHLVDLDAEGDHRRLVLVLLANLTRGGHPLF